MAKSDNQRDEHLASVRETVESIWVAIILAFVLRAFVLEAFVIPTGSMAPRLLGRHWQFDCPACGYIYSYGIPQNNLRARSGAMAQPIDRNGKESGPPAVCPNCGLVNSFERDYPYGGDRVLVLKYLYRFSQPRPWDVVVFKNPQDNEQNYIKRLVGLPGRQIEIVHGDVFYRVAKDFDNNGIVDENDFKYLDRVGGEDANWRILRKPPKTQKVMWQVVFNNDYLPDPDVYRRTMGRDWRLPWAGDSAWDLGWDGGRVFAFAGSAEPAELRFATTTLSDRERFLPNYAYNRQRPRGNRQYNEDRDVNSDLKLSFSFVPKAADARVGLHLSSFNHHFRAWVGADGSCVLEHGIVGESGEVKWDKTPRYDLMPLRLGRAYEVVLTHVDRRVTLWLDGKAVVATTDAQYHADRDWIVRAVRKGVPTPKVAILGQGGPAELRHIKVMRDVFYTSPYMYTGRASGGNRKGWGTTGNPITLRKFVGNPDMDEFFVLGDNSPASLDSRLWDHPASTLRPGYRKGTVPRYNMIGRAFFVYWPGGFRMPLLPRLPIVPNVGRMRLIR